MGCVSDSDYKALEQRVSNLEQQLGVPTETDSASNIANAVDAESETSTDELDTNEESCAYYIDALSDDKVVAECKYYFENIPSQGESFDSYLSKVKATPRDLNQEHGVNLQFYGSENNEITNHDAITSIRIDGSQTEMDGSIGYSGNSYAVSINLIILDYNRASNIYAQLYDIIFDDEHIEVTLDRRDSTNWVACGRFFDAERNYEDQIMKMTKSENGYYIEATYFRWL